MPGVCLVNMNARLYDPQIGRFMAADPSDGSGLNRYWYVGDNPLSLTDPTGLCFLGCFWKSPTGKAVIDIVLVIILHEYALPLIEEQLAVTVADVANIAASAGIAGYITTGKLDSALIQSAEAVAMYGVGQYVDGLEDTHAVTDFQGAMIRFGLHGLVGGLGSAAGRGGFVSGFLAAGFGAAADAIDTGELPIDTVIHAVAGGLGSVLGGGKFADGAVTAAFGYLFNDLTEVHGLPMSNNQLHPYFDDKVSYDVKDLFDDLNSWGMPVKVTSGFRTDVDQARQSTSAFGHARVGQSLHEVGYAFDVNWRQLTPEERQFLLLEARAHGFTWGGTFRRPDIVHFQYDPWGTGANGLAARRAHVQPAQRQYHQLTGGH